MATFPNLTQVSTPNGAQAAATQLLSNTSVPTPRGFREPNDRVLTSIKVPHRDAAMWFKQIHAGYISAQFLGVVRGPSEFLHLYMADSQELVAAAKWNPGAEHGFDGTVRPRRMSVWVQVVGDVAAAAAGAAVLDAVAHWSQLVTPKGEKIATKARFNVVGGADALEFAKRSRLHSVRCTEGVHHWSWRVSIRWADSRMGERCEMAEFTEVPKSTDEALALLQQSVVRLAGAHDAPIHTALMMPVDTRVPHNCYSGHPQSAPLEDTGVVVRLSERRMGEAGITHETAFHGVLLSFGQTREEARSYALNAAETAERDLGAPLGMQEALMALHVCAVHAEKRQIGQLVTLYGPVGKCGEPFHERGGAWVWVESAAIRPIEVALLKDWCVYPCSKESLMPGNDAFHEAYRTHFARAAELYTNIDKYKLSKTDSSISLATTVTAPSLDALPPRPASPPTATEMATQRHILSALRVGLDSRRTTIGEACAYLMEYDPTSQIVKMMMTAGGKLGVRASLSNMVALATQSIQVASAGLQVVEENTRLKRLLDVAFEARATELEEERIAVKQARTVINVQSNDRVRRMIKTLNLKAGTHATIHQSASTDVTATLELLREWLGEATVPIAAALPIQQLGVQSHDKEGWDRYVLRALCKVIDLILRNGMHDQPTHYAQHFVLASTAGEKGMVSVNQMHNVHPGVGELMETTFDQMIGWEKPKVLLLNFLDNGQVRVTATVSST
jgi:hypothetical protein